MIRHVFAQKGEFIKTISVSVHMDLEKRMDNVLNVEVARLPLTDLSV